MADVKYQHLAYDEALPSWQKTRLAATASGIKKAGVKYLPKGADKNDEKYAVYLQRALYLGVTGRTNSALTGAVFRKEPSFTEDLPESIEFIESDFDGEGMGIDQVAKRMVSEILLTGRNGILVDFPSVPEGASREDEQRMGVKPYAASYTAESIINWETTKENGTNKLTMVVLCEKSFKSKDGDRFSREEVLTYRALILDDGLYINQLYDDSGDLIEEFQPKLNGERMDFIPFYFTGAEDNKPTVDEIPLESIAEINIGHYRNSADFEKNLYIHSGGTLGITTSMGSDEWKEMNPNGILVGADQGVFLGDSGSMTLLQLEPASATSEAMKAKEDQMVSIGARLITTNAINETAEAARIAASSETSVLSTIVGNIETTLNLVVELMAEFMKAEAPKYSLNREFFDSVLTAQEWMAANVSADRGDIAQSDLRNMLKRAGILDADRSDKDIDSENASNTPL